MDSPADKTDASSIKPVSSLLARFENINQTQPQSTAPARSPAPKPDRLRSFKTTGDAAVAPVTPTKPSVPKQKPPVKPKHLHSASLPPQQTRLALDDTVVIPPPVTVQPPQSPPQEHRSKPIRGDQSPFLDPSTASSHPLASSKPSSATSSRPLTPTHGLPPPRSPRLAGSKPPSPPPPRRSMEARREKEARTLTPASTGRSEKPVGAGLSVHSFPDRLDSLPRASSKDPSPFTSPPSSSSESEGESPPQLPTRPRPAPNNVPPRQNTSVSGFQPPPIHHSVVDKRRDQNGLGISQRDAHSLQDDDEPPPPLPVRRPTHETPSKAVATRDMAPPPRPVRVLAQQPPSKRDPAPASHPSSLVTQQFLPPPSRNRSRTIESKNSDRMDYPVSTSPEPKGPVEESSLPNIACINRKAPYVKKGCYEIQTRYEPKRFDVCGDVVCTSGSFTRGWNTLDGEQLMSLAHTEGVKATAIIFKPGADPDTEATRIWVGMNSGDMMEVDVATSRIVCNKPGAHGRYEVLKAHRYLNEIWTLDESGCLHIWGPDDDGIPNLNKNPTQSYKVPKGHTFSLVADGQLWHVSDKSIRVFEPSLDGSTTFQVLMKPLVTEGTADITSGTTMDAHPGKIFFGHVDGKVSIYTSSDYSCQKVINISGWKINTLAAVGADLWVGYSTGKVCIYDTKKNPWMTKKEWQAHDSGIHQLKTDATAPYRIERAQVVSVGNDGKVKFWDALLQDDKLEENLKSNEAKYCQFDDLSLMVMTWNAGASTPHSLRYSEGDASFFQEFVQTSGSPDILVFGFQELVDLEDKTATAKRFLKSSKKKDSSDNEHMSHRYRDWRDFLLKTLDDYAPQGHLYQLLYNAPLVGLFTCIFVKSSLQGRIRNLQGAEVKRGMGGLHGNKGAIAVRFQIDDSSLCFVNCHLAAGQTQTSSRHNDIAAILEANLFSIERDASARQDYYRGGGDGGMIVDHEICVINGDLNYRIDTMSRDTVVKAVQQGNLGKLRDRDQLLVSRRKNPAFRLRAFEELPLSFAPTYKYDVGTDRYDTSEKRRSPAWCDRLLYRANGKIEQLDYGRHEIKVSDHRPVSGSFKLRVKAVDDRKRAQVVMEAHNAFEDLRQKHLDEAK
ncbi:hypothetical protein NLG97_g8114 [Lecanicillium saksenae]|uniref:Uncharacterized protein n=1 Tax=Lecanicillium saksenae TaxID=468837 RepID=A0ACC1QJU5_9HYPO|nr:hypothetical protein NLG97_g8114 [Lecanicillium saksenae]